MIWLTVIEAVAQSGSRCERRVGGPYCDAARARLTPASCAVTVTLEDVRLKVATRRTSFREHQLDGPVQPQRDAWLPDRIVPPVRWYRLAAEQGHAAAQYNLGVAYAEGEGVRQDDVQAHMWFNLAAAEGSEARPPERRDEVAAEMPPAHPREP